MNRPDKRIFHCETREPLGSWLICEDAIYMTVTDRTPSQFFLDWHREIEPLPPIETIPLDAPIIIHRFVLYPCRTKDGDQGCCFIDRETQDRFFIMLYDIKPDNAKKVLGL